MKINKKSPSARIKTQNGDMLVWIAFTSFTIIVFLIFFIILPLTNTKKNLKDVKNAQAAPSGYALSWGDEFDAITLDTSCSGSNTWADYFCKFNTRRLDGNSDDGIKMHSDWKGANPSSGAKTIREVLTEAGWPSPSLHDASNGTLKLRAYPIPSLYQNQFNWNGATNPSAASMITSEKSHSQTYGYWEVRAKLNTEPKNKHFSIWLMPQDGSWPPEIDLLETVIDINNKSAGILSSANSHGETPDVPITFFKPAGGMLNVWHTYGFEWTPTTMIWTVDGQVVRSHPNYVNKPMYILASWEVGGSWSGNTDQNTNWPGEMEIDYVRVYTQGAGPTSTQAPQPTTVIPTFVCAGGSNCSPSVTPTMPASGVTITQPVYTSPAPTAQTVSPTGGSVSPTAGAILTPGNQIGPTVRPGQPGSQNTGLLIQLLEIIKQLIELLTRLLKF